MGLFLRKPNSSVIASITLNVTKCIHIEKQFGHIKTTGAGCFVQSAEVGQKGSLLGKSKDRSSSNQILDHEELIPFHIPPFKGICQDTTAIPNILADAFCIDIHSRIQKHVDSFHVVNTRRERKGKTAVFGKVSRMGYKEFQEIGPWKLDSLYQMEAAHNSSEANEQLKCLDLVCEPIL
ncbi:hypothetical protein VMCG_06777 [Cytospora schulzeri]|uniref:Uncharacterized protein n=1 Tax=Cytospora schulzeri TaxID=448051 RepID=A0A423W5S5_9PEZI|nr:hypothetical protein VMCG_06777 [Valsa malicola]